MIYQIPKHVAIVMDGNGRWAEKKGYNRVFGHVKGCQTVREVVKEAISLKIKALTLYAFSTENWQRPEEEVEVLWKLLKKYLQKEEQRLHEENIQLRVIGQMHRLSADVRQLLIPLLDKLSKNTGLRLTFALSYGSRSELADAAKMFAQDCLRGLQHPHYMNEHLMSQYLYQTEYPQDVDLFIRTSGEKRLSNFLLWQIAYAELIFVDKYWPDFTAKDFNACIKEYAQRNRRFGNVLAFNNNYVS